MAVYKVPQDVEADDKLIGPFSFRQFIYLIVVAIAMAGAWGLSQLFLALAIIPLPIIVFFAALALPLRKDQPMEAYLSAVVSFYFLKSRKRFWIPDGIDSFVTIIPPKDAEKIFTKDLNEDEATKRLTYLADLVDTHGWAIRGAGGTPDTSINTDLYYESQNTVDMMDGGTDAAKAMSAQLQKEAETRKQDAIDTMKTAPTPATTKEQSVPVAVPVAAESAPAPVQTETPSAGDQPPVSKLPSIQELRARESQAQQQQIRKEGLDALAYTNALLEEAGEKPAETATKNEAETAPNTSVSTPDTDTMGITRKQADELSQQKDVSLETLSKQANRVAAKNQEVLKDGDEVTISFH